MNNKAIKRTIRIFVYPECRLTLGQKFVLESLWPTSYGINFFLKTD